eukprot:800377-Rhodomonas_salina.1
MVPVALVAAAGQHGQHNAHSVNHSHQLNNIRLAETSEDGSQSPAHADWRRPSTSYRSVPRQPATADFFVEISGGLPHSSDILYEGPVVKLCGEQQWEERRLVLTDKCLYLLGKGKTDLRDWYTSCSGSFAVHGMLARGLWFRVLAGADCAHSMDCQHPRPRNHRGQHGDKISCDSK